MIFSDSDDVTAGVQVANGLDLTALTAGEREVGSVNATNGTLSAVFTEDTILLGTANFGTAKVSVDEGKTLTGPASTFTGAVITGAGNVAVTGLAATTDLSDITVAGTKTATVASSFTFTGDLGGFSTSVGAGYTLTLDAVKATGKTISGDASTVAQPGGSIVVTGLGATAVDFTNITAGAKVGAGNAGTFVAQTFGTAILAANSILGTAQVEVGTGHDLTMSAEQANNRIITDAGNTGNLTITGLKADTDLDKVDFGGTSTKVAARIDSSINITANTKLADVDHYSVTEGTTLTLSTAQASALAGIANGTIFSQYTSPTSDETAKVVITGDLSSNANLNLVTGTGASKLDTVKLTFDDNAIVVNSGSVLSIATADLATTQTVSGAGRTDVYNLQGTSDLSKVTTDMVKAIVLDNANITANTKLSTVDTFEVANGKMLTLSAAQANSVDVDMLGNGTTGAATIIATSGDEDLDMTDSTANITVNLGSGDDTFTGGFGIDTITGGNGQDIIRGAGGNDIIKLTEGTPAIDTVVFEASASANGNDAISNFTKGTGGDVLDFSAFLTSGGVSDADAGTAGLQNYVLGATAENISGNIALLEVANIGAVTQTTIADEFAAGETFANLTNGSKAIVLVGEASGTDGINVYYVTGTLSGTENVELVGVLQNENLTGFASNNFGFSGNV